MLQGSIQQLHQLSGSSPSLTQEEAGLGEEDLLAVLTYLQQARDILHIDGIEWTEHPDDL